MIKLSKVSKSYSGETNIGPIDLEIPSGGITALIGPNGAGKSTMLTMIGRLLDVDEGTIEVAGYDVSSTKSQDLAKILSILRQENHFITKLTVTLMSSPAASVSAPTWRWCSAKRRITCFSTNPLTTSTSPTPWR